MKTVFDIPGYIEALDAEQLSRDVAFLPVPEFIGEFPAVPLTLERFLILRVAQSPFLMPSPEPTATHLATFLWVVSPEYKYQPPPKHFLRRCRFKDETFAEMVKASIEYMEDALMDRPVGPGACGFKASLYSDAAFWCVLLKQPRAEVLNTPLKCLFQFFRAYVEQNGQSEKLSLHNARSSGVVNEFLQQQNRTN